MSAPGNQSPKTPSHHRSGSVQNGALNSVTAQAGNGSSRGSSGSPHSTESSEQETRLLEYGAARLPTSPTANGGSDLRAVSAETTDGVPSAYRNGDSTIRSGTSSVDRPITVDLVERTGPKSAISVSGSNPVILQTKSFELTSFPDQLFQYSVVVPEIKIKGCIIKSARVEKEILRKLLLYHRDFSDLHSHIATDRKSSFFSTVPLLPEGMTEKPVSVRITCISGPIIPTIKTEGLINFADLNKDKDGKLVSYYSKDLDALSAVIQRSLFRFSGKWLPVGGGKYFERLQLVDEQQRATSLGYGLHPRKGFLVSVQGHTHGVLLNLSATTTAFYNQGRMVDFLQKWFTGADLRKLSRQQLSELKILLTGLQVRYSYQPPDPKSLSAKNHARGAPAPRISRGISLQLRRINGFGTNAAEQVFKHDRLHVSMSVQQWFDDYVQPENKRLAYPELPIVNTGTRERPVWVPLEVLEIEPHQPLLCNLRQNRVKALKMFIAREAAKDVASLLESAEDALKLHDLRKEFHIELKPYSQQIQGHLLPHPGLQEAETNHGLIEKINPRIKLELLVVHYSTFKAAVISTDKEARTQTFTNPLKTKLSRLGIFSEISVPGRIAVVDQGSLNIPCPYFLNPKPEASVHRIVLVVTENDDNIGYAKIKHWSDCKAGLFTVCVVDDPRQPQRFTKPKYISSVAQKIALKLGGTKLAIQCPDKLHGQDQCATMVVGVGSAVFAGPATGSSLGLMGVVASSNYEVTEYQNSLRLSWLWNSEDRKKINEGFEHTMHEQLVSWHGRHGTLPKNILLYRAGVDESQHARIKDEELKTLHRAFEQAKTSLQSDCSAPNVTFIVVETNHKKLFDLKEQEQEKYRDVKTGLNISAPKTNQHSGMAFYLQNQTVTGEKQHAARQGHYHVLENGMQLSKENLEEITYALCAANVSFGARKSYVAPAYYANKLCKRGQLYLKAMRDHEKDAWLARGSPWEGKALEGKFFYL